MNIHSCDPKALCTNTGGSYECTCTDGFAKNGQLCIGNRKIFLFAERYGELITATYFGNITCLNSHIILIIFMIDSPNDIMRRGSDTSENYKKTNQFTRTMMRELITSMNIV